MGTPYTIQMIPTGDLVPNPDNPRFISKEQFDLMVRSLEELPDLFMARPCLCVDRDGKKLILGGNMRWRAAETLGWTEVPAIVMENLSEDQEREIVIKDNGQFGGWDFVQLANS